MRESGEGVKQSNQRSTDPEAQRTRGPARPSLDLLIGLPRLNFNPAVRPAGLVAAFVFFSDMTLEGSGWRFIGPFFKILISRYMAHSTCSMPPLDPNRWLACWLTGRRGAPAKRREGEDWKASRHLSPDGVFLGNEGAGPVS